jgi:hypothetical protein
MTGFLSSLSQVLKHLAQIELQRAAFAFDTLDVVLSDLLTDDRDRRNPGCSVQTSEDRRGSNVLTLQATVCYLELAPLAP